MRILYFSRNFTTHDWRFLAALAETGHKVGFLQLEKSEIKFDDRPLPQGVTQIMWVGGQSQARWFNVPKLVVGLQKVVREFRPDLIQAGPIQRSAFITALAGFRPLVTMSWGYDLLFDVHKGPGWKWATQYTLRHSDALITDCETTKNIGVRLGMTPERVIAFPWGANIRKYRPIDDKAESVIRKQLGWGRDDFVLLSTRSWSKIYGVDNLAAAFVKAVKKQPNLRLLMLGDGPMAEDIKGVFSQGGVSDYVHYPGLVTQEALPDYYRAADLYISSSHSDGTSISLLEAIASGVPVLLTDIPSNKEWVITPGEFGWLYKDGNVDSLTHGILQAYDNREALPAMGRAARDIAEVKADWELNFPRLFEAYKIALS